MSTDDRCAAVLSLIRCELPKGHAGEHHTTLSSPPAPRTTPEPTPDNFPEVIDMQVIASGFRRKPNEVLKWRDLGDGRFVCENTYGDVYEFFPGRPITIPPRRTEYVACTCYAKAPTVPVYRDRMTHLDGCPEKDSGNPVGMIRTAPQPAASLSGTPAPTPSIDSCAAIPPTYPAFRLLPHHPTCQHATAQQKLDWEAAIELRDEACAKEAGGDPLEAVRAKFQRLSARRMEDRALNGGYGDRSDPPAPTDRVQEIQAYLDESVNNEFNVEDVANQLHEYTTELLARVRSLEAEKNDLEHTLVLLEQTNVGLEALKVQLEGQMGATRSYLAQLERDRRITPSLYREIISAAHPLEGRPT